MGQVKRVEIFMKRMNHAKSRLIQRHGIYLEDSEYYYLINQIIEGESQFIMRFSKSRTLHKVYTHNQWVPVVYSNKQKVIVTVFANKWIKGINANTFVMHKDSKYHAGRNYGKRKRKKGSNHHLNPKRITQATNIWV